MIDTGILDDAMSRVSNGVAFVNLLSLQGYSNQAIEEGIHHYLDTPTSVGDWEKIITDNALQYLKQQNNNNLENRT